MLFKIAKLLSLVSLNLFFLTASCSNKNNSEKTTVNGIHDLNKAKSVSEIISNYKLDEKILVKGSFVGVSEVNNKQGIILKDVYNDNYIFVNSLPSSFYSLDSINFNKWDYLLFEAKTRKEKDFIYLEYDDILNSQEIVFSHGDTTFSFDDVIEISKNNDFTVSLDKDLIKPYKLVHITNNLFFARDSQDYFVHKNSRALSFDDCIYDNKQILIDSNSLDFNIGKNWYKRLFGTSDDVFSIYSYTNVKNNLSLYGLVLPDNKGYRLSILDSSWLKNDSSKYDIKQALLNTAKAYFYRGTNIRYDQTNLRRETNIAPEEAVDNNKIYLDCSAYTNSVYFNTFGRNNFSAGRSKNTSYNEMSVSTTKGIIPYSFSTGGLSKEQINLEIVKFKKALLPGDLIMYHNDSSYSSNYYFGNHIMMYNGNNEIIHCIGGDYYSSSNFSDRYERNRDDALTTFEFTHGAINKISADFLFADNPTELSFYNYGKSCYIFRPYVLAGYDSHLTDEAIARFKAPDLTFSKNCNVGYNNSVYQGDEISFTIVLENKGKNSIDNIEVDDYIPNGTKLSQISFSQYEYELKEKDNFKLKNISLKPNEKKYIKYKVKVTANEGTIKVPNAYVNDIPSNSFKFTISKISKETMINILESARTKIDTTPNTDPLLLFNTIYNDVLNQNIVDSKYTTTASIQNDLFDTTNYTINYNSNVCKILVPQMYGGRGFTKANQVPDYGTANDNARDIEISNLALGDMLFDIESNGTVYAYVYLGDRKLLKASSTSNFKVVEYTVEDSIFRNELVRVYGSNFFFVLRPSIIYS